MEYVACGYQGLGKAGMGVSVEREQSFSLGRRVSSGDGWWPCLHNSMSAFNATELYT